MKRVFSGMAAALLAAVLFFPLRTQAISAQSAILMDATTGRVLYEKDADRQSLIASTTKIMTALVICEQCNVLDRVRIPKEAVGVEGSSIYLREGEILTVQELLYGLMLHSGNDAAVALAIYCGGTVEGFAQRMNDKAHLLGMDNTHFVNPNGLDAPGHFSTARDMAVLTAYAMENPIFRQTVSTKSVKVAERYLTNHNKLLWSVEGADGVKTGYTKAAGRILVSSATRNDRRLVAVTINAPDDWNDHKALLNEGFAQYEVRQIVWEGQCLGSIEVAGGVDDSVPLIARESYRYALAPQEEPETLLSGIGFVYAPVEKDQDAGWAYVVLDGKAVGKIPLVYGDTVEQKKVETNFWHRIFGGEANG